jgi:hypothetical protein
MARIPVKKPATAVKKPAPVAKATIVAKPRRGIEGKIQDVAEIEGHLTMAVYGRSGAGKTTFACSFPDALLIDVNDRGTKSVRDVKGLKVLRVEDWDDLEDIYWYLESGKHTFKSVIIDTVTMMQEFAIQKVASQKKKKKDDETAGNFGTMTRQEWGEVSSMMKTWIMHFRELEMNVVFLAQERIFNADEESEDQQLAPEVGPRLMPSVGSTLNAAVDILGNAFVRENIKRKKEKNGKTTETRSTQYCMRVGPHALYTTKVRNPKSSVVPRFLIDATYDDIIELVNGED